MCDLRQSEETRCEAGLRHERMGAQWWGDEGRGSAVSDNFFARNQQLSCLMPALQAQSLGMYNSASKSYIWRFVITEKARSRAFSWLKAATTAFTFKTLLRHYAKRALTPRSLNVKLGPRRNYHKGRAAIGSSWIIVWMQLPFMMSITAAITVPSCSRLESQKLL